jgi:hypothetical protein
MQNCSCVERGIRDIDRDGYKRQLWRAHIWFGSTRFPWAQHIHKPHTLTQDCSEEALMDYSSDSIGILSSMVSTEYSSANFKFIRGPKDLIVGDNEPCCFLPAFMLACGL